MLVNASRPRRWLIFAVPFLFLGATLWMKTHFAAQYHSINEEDHLVQNLQVLFYASAAILLFVAAWRFSAQPRSMRWVVLLAAVALVFIVGEEIQWGQDIFHFRDPAFFAANNVENETNVHNLAGIDSRVDYAFMVVGFLGGLGWLIPEILVKWIPLRKWFIPPWYLSLYFLPLTLYGLLWKAKTNPAFLGGVLGGWQPFLDRHLDWWDQEPTELLFAAACIIVAVGILQLAKQGTGIKAVT